MIVSAFKMLFGDVPAQWIRLILFGAGITFLVLKAGDFATKMQNESVATREALTEYIASNKAWQDASMSQRRVLLKRVERRFERLYQRNGWDYEWIEADQ